MEERKPISEDVERARSFAEKVYNDCKANGLTLKEFCTLVGLLSTRAYEIKKEFEQKALAEKLQ